MRRSVRSWFIPAMVALAYGGLIIEFMLLIPLLREQGERAAQGRQARVQQCAFRPLSLREQQWFADRGVITAAELRMIERALPSAAQCRTVTRQK